jgi:catechol 2,3-dioxygenase-like lactoylglutathione lyase family enzyme
MAEAKHAIEGLGAVTLHVRDIAVARRFYAEVLGLREVTFQPERQRAVYEIPGSPTLLTMHVMTDPREGGREPGTVTGVVFSHHDPKGAIELLRGRGATIVAEPQTMPWGMTRAVFADPDGNEFIVASPG